MNWSEKYSSNTFDILPITEKFWKPTILTRNKIVPKIVDFLGENLPKIQRKRNFTVNLIFGKRKKKKFTKRDEGLYPSLYSYP